MNRYPEGELGFYDIVKWSFRLHYLTLKYSISCILLITIAKYASLFVMAFFQNYYAVLAVKCVFALPIVFLFSAALLATDRAFTNNPQSIGAAILTVWHRVVPIYLTFIVYTVGAPLVYYICHMAILLLDKMFEAHAASMTMHGSSIIIMSSLVLVFIGMFFFSYPLAVIDEKSFLKAFRDSAILTEKNKLGIFFLMALLLAISILLKPGTMHEYFLSLYHLDVLYDFVVLCVMVPLFINVLLFLIHDSKQQLLND